MYLKKCVEKAKKVLTKGKVCVNIQKLFKGSRYIDTVKYESKNFLKKVKKVLDNAKMVWYT